MKSLLLGVDICLSAAFGIIEAAEGALDVLLLLVVRHGPRARRFVKGRHEQMLRMGQALKRGSVE